MPTLPPLPPIPGQTHWYYADTNSQLQGPFPLAELKRLFASGAITPETYVIEENGTEWKRFPAILGEAGASSPMPPAKPPGAKMLPRWATTAHAKEPRRWPVILALILFYPVGVILLWTRPGFSKQERIIWTSVLGGFFALGVIMDSFHSPAEATNRTTSLAATEPAKKNTEDAETRSQRLIAEHNLLEKRQAETKEQLGKVLRGVFGKNLMSVEIDPLAEDGSRFSVGVGFDAADGLKTTNAGRWIEEKMAEAYRAVYTSGIDTIGTLAIDAHCSNAVIQKRGFGLNSDLIIYQTEIPRDTAKTVDWANVSATELTKIWDTNLTYQDFWKL